MLAAAVAVYYLARRSLSRRGAVFSAALFAFNPAVIFDAVVWGETEAILTAALVLAALALISGRPKLGWSFLAVAVLLKQTGLFLVPIAAIYSIKRFGLQATVVGGAVGALCGLTLISPLIFLGYHPSTVYQPFVAQVQRFAAPEAFFASSDTFSVWTLVNGAHGLSGFARLWAPYALEIAGVTFATLGSICFLVAAAATVWIAWRSTNANPQTFYLATAVLFVAYVAFSTLASARYLLLALPFVILADLKSATFSRWLTIGGLTAIAFVSQYGILMEIAVRGDWPSFVGLGNPSTNAVSGFIYRVYTSDIAITVLAVLLVVIVFGTLFRLDRLSFAGLTPSRKDLSAAATK